MNHHISTIIKEHPPSVQPHRSSTLPSSPRKDVKDKNTKRNFSKICTTVKCYKCPAYGNVVANCPSSFKIVITDKVCTEAPKPNSTISPKVTPVNKESCFPDYHDYYPFCCYHNCFLPFPSLGSTADTTFSASITIDSYCHWLLWSSTSSSSIIAPSPVITELVKAPSEDLLDKSPPTRDTQHPTNLALGARLPSLPHHRIEPIKHTELEEQADMSPLEIKQQCLVPIDTLIYENKFWCEIVIRNVDQIKEVIYG